MSIEDKRFLQIMSNTAELQNGHYQLALPFKEDKVIIPNNRSLAKQRLKPLLKKFNKNPKFLNEYKSFLEGVIEKGYAEVIPPEQVNTENGKTWYLPHHGVYYPRKRSLRVVFDYSAFFQGVSLNNQLIQGPNLTNTLLGVLLQFRKEPIAVMADVESIFHQVKVAPAHKDFLCFLWWPGGDVSKSIAEYRMTVHLFGATSSSSCANYTLTKAAEDNEDNYSAETISTVKTNFYVDDCLRSMTSDEEAISLCKELQDVCTQGGFRFSKWISNSRAVLMSIPENERAK